VPLRFADDDAAGARADVAVLEEAREALVEPRRRSPSGEGEEDVLVEALVLEDVAHRALAVRRGRGGGPDDQFAAGAREDAGGHPGIHLREVALEVGDVVRLVLEEAHDADLLLDLAEGRHGLDEIRAQALELVEQLGRELLGRLVVG